MVSTGLFSTWVGLIVLERVFTFYILCFRSSFLAPMKIFKRSEVESVAISKWGSMGKLENELEKRRRQNSKLEERKEEEKRHFWEREELFEPLKPFMENIELPSERVSPYFREKRDRPQGDVSMGLSDSQELCSLDLS